MYIQDVIRDQVTNNAVVLYMKGPYLRRTAWM